MAKKKAEQIGQGIGLIIGLAMVAALLAAAVLPLFLAFRYLQHYYLSYRLRKDYDLAENGWWLSEEERASFKERCAAEKLRGARNQREHENLQSLIAAEHQRASEAGIPTNMDGSYSRRSYLGREIQEKIEELEGHCRNLDLDEYEISCRQPREFWHELNDLLKKKDVAFVGLLGWACGAFFFYSAYQEGAPFGLWFDLFAPALCAGAGAGLAALFSRNPARRYLPKPIWITIDEVDRPRVQLPQRKRLGLKLAGVCVWFGLIVFAGINGREYGVAEAAYHRNRVREQEIKDAENKRREEEIMAFGKMPSEPESNAEPEQSGQRTPDIVNSDLLSNLMVSENFPYALDIYEISKMNTGELENLIVAVYALHGAEFASKSAQDWANQLTWYRRVRGRTIKDAELEFSPHEQKLVRLSAEQWNTLRENEGLSRIPIEESPLAGRAVSPELEEDGHSNSSIVLKALPANEVAVQGSLNPEEIERWDEAKVRTEINTIYARQGIVFPSKELQEWAVRLPGYKPIPGLSYDEAEAGFSDTERHNIEMLAARRDRILGKATVSKALPVAVPLDPQLVATWDAARVRYEINSIYARYGVEFPSRELQTWAEKQPWYQRVPGRTFEDVDAMIEDVERHNIELLAARRDRIKEGSR